MYRDTDKNHVVFPTFYDIIKQQQNKIKGQEQNNAGKDKNHNNRRTA
jgi:hypothetical protein